ncbi:phosphatidylinositol mannoside acyltransferase [Corynebacterium uberis]|uniref:phosphatidylinositol mannoside acyltransferase n=1 Tax=Corynebacterium TaxID=1716 RepID=UPI001D09DA24|nr:MULTISPECIES: phosphatidylinositol mannoside acyltransferase [Corynebacterium]MCZ9308536.1 phosphatidylinositol mannoside acyltransferase [Corynebacterium sp. c6VSa_13]UDL74188.1 phosphatidylinositol mannoside acyltransferase [Corynebacterium uberis]UDL74928.1 phosphatidylinositol mannoside acyltransferase [Corynebacterium uberis]UDL77143.1 phosphatidylinositol mannoside acyltransferase [Corynebacterium uberis]UDL79425.1 phosphatidylinositol mannoside acyltransferase [Corynebacterium uberis
MSAQETLSAWGYRAGWAVVRGVPPVVTRRAFQWAADRVSDDGRGCEQLRANLARVVGDAGVTRQLVRDSMRSYARYWEEAFRLPTMMRQPGLLDQLVAGTEGLEHLEESLASRRGVVVVLPHTGNWDMAGLLLAQRYTRFTTVAERLRPESLYQAFVDYRRTLGFDVLALTGQGPVLPRLAEVTRSGGVVCLVGERDLKRRGVPVEFFGEQTTMPTGAVELAAATGAHLHVVHSWFTGTGTAHRGWGLSVSPRVQVSSVASTQQAVAEIFERNIRRHPHDWHMLQPLWPADVTERKSSPTR